MDAYIIPSIAIQKKAKRLVFSLEKNCVIGCPLCASEKKAMLKRKVK